MKNIRMAMCLTAVAITAGMLNGTAGADSFEPDNVSAEAKTITTDGQAQSHSIDPAADEDWLTFSIEALSGVVIETSGISGDTIMSLYNEQVVELLSDDDGGAGSFSRIQTTLPTGTYYVRIKEYNNKALISEYFASVLASPIKILSVTSDSAPRGENLAVTITGQNTTFFQGSSTVTRVWLSKGITTIDANSFTGIDATTLEVTFDIPANALMGKWSVHVSNSVDGELPSFVNGFLIYAYPDLNGDGKVDAIDFALLARHWQEATVPNIVGMTEADATSAITETSLEVGTVTQQYSDTISAGRASSQDPASGDVVNIGSAVNLVISLGKPVVPNVVGMTQAEATAAITDIDNLTVGTVTQAYSVTVAVGLVIGQTPASGTIVNTGSVVNLVISGVPAGMVLVPSGDYKVDGSTNQYVAAYMIDQYEVTNTQYAEFLNNADPTAQYWTSNMEIVRFGTSGSYYYTVITGKENYPIRFVSFNDATAYANWKSQETGQSYHLPDEHQRQKAAGWDPVQNKLWNYGFQRDTIDSTWCNYDNPYGGPLPVGSFNGTGGKNDAKSYYGCYDMSGNVWEWTTEVSGVYRVVRGGDWRNSAAYCAVTYAFGDGLTPTYRDGHFGFRLVLD